MHSNSSDIDDESYIDSANYPHAQGTDESSVENGSNDHDVSIDNTTLSTTSTPDGIVDLSEDDEDSEVGDEGEIMPALVQHGYEYASEDDGVPPLRVYDSDSDDEESIVEEGDEESIVEEGDEESIVEECDEEGGEEEGGEDGETVAAESNTGQVYIDSIRAALPERFRSPDVLELLCKALVLVGFSLERQARVKSSTENLNLKRYRAFFGEDPIVHQALINDLEERYDDFDVKNLLMTLNWLKGYDNLHVLAGRWDRGENYIGKKVEVYTKRIQSLKEHKIQFKFETTEHHTFIASYDTVNFKTTEYRLDPSNKWFDFKSNSTGLVSKMMLTLKSMSRSSHSKPCLYRSMSFASRSKRVTLCG